MEDPEVDGRIILKCFLRKWGGEQGLDYLAENRDRWRVLVNAVMNFRVP